MGAPKKRILIIEDDRPLAIVLRNEVESMGMIAHIKFDGEEGLELAKTRDYSLIITDITMPRLSGLDVLKAIRSADVNTPVIVMTNFYSPDKEIITYNSGANLFHKKPISFDLLKAQIRMLVDKYKHLGPVTIGDLIIDPQKAILKKAGKRIDLTKKEFDLMLALVSAPGEIFTRRQIIDLTNVGVREVDEGSVDTLVSRVRDKLGDYKGDDTIETVYKQGFRLSYRYLE